MIAITRYSTRELKDTIIPVGPVTVSYNGVTIGTARDIKITHDRVTCSVFLDSPGDSECDELSDPQ